MRRLAKAIDGLEEPAVEKIAKDQQEDPFQVLIATMLSAQTKDAVTAAASERLFRVARTPKPMAKLPVRQIEKLIYPVSFYRNKAVHVRQTCEQLLTRYRRPRAVDDGRAPHAAGRRPQDREPGADPRARQPGEHLRRHARAPDRQSSRLGRRPARPKRPSRRSIAPPQRRWWPIINLYLVTWGQNVCRPVYPLCPQCVLVDICPKIGVTKVGKLVKAARPEVGG